MFGSVTLIWLFAFLSMVHGNIHIYFMIKYWTEDTLYQLKLQVNLKAIFLASGGRDDSARCLPEQVLSVDFIQRKTNLKTNKVLVKPSFNQSEWVTYRSDLMISLFSSYIPFTLNVYVR